MDEDRNGMGAHDQPSDAERWARVVAGDPRAFEELFDRHANAIFAFCLRRTGDRAAAEDLMSATHLHGWRRRGELHLADTGPLPWLYGAAANLTWRIAVVGFGELAPCALPADLDL
jgi:hypothetical protein